MPPSAVSFSDKYQGGSEMATNLADDASKLAQKASDRIDAASEETKDMAQRAARKASDRIDTVSDQAKDMAQRAARTAQETGEAAWDVAQRAHAQAREVAGEAYAQGERTARELARRVEEQPLMALLIAGAVGYAMAYLLHGRR
jgi:ElaB/YqjD/DUF883 family membrane-anchored ribosome-binding protein